jgi:hypothetical protein
MSESSVQTLSYSKHVFILGWVCTFFLRCKILKWIGPSKKKNKKEDDMYFKALIKSRSYRMAAKNINPILK